MDWSKTIYASISEAIHSNVLRLVKAHELDGFIAAFMSNIKHFHSNRIEIDVKLLD